MISASRSVQILQNCFVDLIFDSGERIEGRWIGHLEAFKTNQPAHRNRPKPKDLVWIENGGERLDSSYYVRLLFRPGKTPIFISIDSIIYKVENSDERDERGYWRYLCVEQFEVNIDDIR